jgi:hypothetical protein
MSLQGVILFVMDSFELRLLQGYGGCQKDEKLFVDVVTGRIKTDTNSRARSMSFQPALD